MLILLALALQSSTTTCTPNGSAIYCNTQNYPQPQFQAPPPMAQVDVGRALRSYDAGRRASELAPTEADITPFQRELAQRMGILARMRRCEDAYRLAELASEPELADGSRRLCPF